MRTLRVLAGAEAELFGAAEWYESKRAGLGVELVAIVERTLYEVLDAPLACPLWRPGKPYRAKPLRRFPYVVFYRLDDDVVEVVAVAHAKRRPGYWAER